MVDKKNRMGDERILDSSDYLTIRSEDTLVVIMDESMFGYVMRQPGVCTSAIKYLLPDIPVAEVKFADEAETVADTQKSIQCNIGNHSVRLDVYLNN